MNYINVPASEVYQALTTHQGLSTTWTQDCQVADMVNGKNIFGFGDEDPTIFRIDELSVNKKIVWFCLQSDPDWTGTKLIFDLQEKDGKTAITLTHSGWKEKNTYYNWCSYNWSFFLYSLKCYCEEESGISFQNRIF